MNNNNNRKMNNGGALPFERTFNPNAVLPVTCTNIHKQAPNVHQPQVSHANGSWKQVMSRCPMSNLGLH